MKAPSIQRMHACSYCDFGITHIIDTTTYPNDVYAERDNTGKWRCGNYVEKPIQDKIIKVIPHSQCAKQILVERQKKR
jgi:hypothetical protein